MANLRSASVREALNMRHDHNTVLLQVVGATKTLLEAINIIDSLVAPKRFNLRDADLRVFEAKDNGFANHSIRVEGESPIDEISEWQIIGTVGDRIVNIVARGVFHTHQHDRSGNRELTINGKPNYKPEYGGINIDDIWQETGEYEKFTNASSLTIVSQKPSGKVITRYH